MHELFNAFTRSPSPVTEAAYSPPADPDPACVVTGGTRGIGRAVSLELARRGCPVVLVGRDADSGMRACAELRRLGGTERIHFVQADIGSQHSVRRAAGEIALRFPRVRALVNNAGVYTFRPRRSADGFELTMAVNHLGALLLTRLLLAVLRRSAPARVLNVTSKVERYAGPGHTLHTAAGIDGAFGLLPYARSKRAMLHATRELAHRLRGSGVTVNSVHPGFVATDLLRDLPRWMRRLYEGFLTTPEKSAHTLAELVTSDAYSQCSGAHFEPGPRLARTSRWSYDTAARAASWRASCKLIGMPVALDDDQVATTTGDAGDA